MYGTILCMSFPIYDLNEAEFPPLLREIPQPPKTLNYRGILPFPDMKLLAVVGSRKYSTYGKQVVEHLISGLRGYNIGIVSGLALGIDSLAHEAALSHNLYTLAVPGSGLEDNVIYPASHKSLARKILEAGSGLLSEFEQNFTATKWSFTQRNRIMAGIAHATLIIEASEKSGTLITARLCSDYNRELLVVPGNIFSQNSVGPHQFLKLGATPVTDAKDILYALGFSQEEVEQKPSVFVQPLTLSTDEERIVEFLFEPKEKDTLIRTLGMESQQANVLLMQMEFKGIIISENGIYRLVI
jgi:DNA processing protein